MKASLCLCLFRHSALKTNEQKVVEREPIELSVFFSQVELYWEKNLNLPLLKYGKRMRYTVSEAIKVHLTPNFFFHLKESSCFGDYFFEKIFGFGQIL